MKKSLALLAIVPGVRTLVGAVFSYDSLNSIFTIISRAGRPRH